jgi:hypothetical protein
MSASVALSNADATAAEERAKTTTSSAADDDAGSSDSEGEGRGARRAGAADGNLLKLGLDVRTKGDLFQEVRGDCTRARFLLCLHCNSIESFCIGLYT